MTGMKLSSAAFDDHTAIPRRFSGEGENVSPPPAWSAAPEGTAEGQKPRGGLPWPNDFGRVGWGGPMPPPGHGPHHYFFRLYALSEPLVQLDAFMTAGADGRDEPATGPQLCDQRLRYLRRSPPGESETAVRARGACRPCASAD